MGEWYQLTHSIFYILWKELRILKFEEIKTYIPKKSPSNFIDMTGFENEFFIVISRAPNAKNGAT